MQEKEIDQLRYFVMYDKNSMINNVIKLFTIYEGITRDDLTINYEFEKIKNIEFEVIEK